MIFGHLPHRNLEDGESFGDSCMFFMGDSAMQPERTSKGFANQLE